MIVTCKPRISFWWVFFAILPWAALGFQGNICGTGFIFTIKKFLENPAALTLILSLPGLMNIIVSPFFSFLSDRIWTRFGRRKPFATVAWIGITVTLVLLPVCPNLWTLSAVFLLHGFFEGMCSTLVPLKLEIIPPQQRGSSVAAMEWTRNIAHIIFSYVALGRFDDVTFLSGLPIGGEKAIYWSGGLVMLALFAFITLAIKEVDQKSPLKGQRFTLRNIVGGLAHNDLWPVYTLIFSAAFLGAGIGPLGTLLQTEQWQFTKQDMGINIAVGGVLNIFLIAVLGIFADRMNRLRAYQILITIALFLKFAYYLYIQFMLPDRIPSLVEVILFGEMLSIIGILKTMIYTPLTTDYVRRNQLGTFQAGSGLMQRLIGFITVNGAGLFITWYSSMFMPHAGDMVRVATREPVTQAQMTQAIEAANWTSAVDGTPVPKGGVIATAWYANGVIADEGRGWEFRLRDEDSERKAEEKAALEQQRSALVAKEQLARYDVRMANAKNDTAKAAAKAAEADALKAEAATLKQRITAIEDELKLRAKKLEAQVRTVFADRLIGEGEQVLSARMRRAVVVEWPITQRPDGTRIEKTLVDLRAQRPDLIDLKVVKRGDGYVLAASALAEDSSADALTGTLRADVAAMLAKRLPDLLGADAAQTVQAGEALEMRLLTVERTIDDRVSPVTRLTNAILGWFDAAPSVHKRIGATARSLRKPGETEHVRIYPGTEGEAREMTVLALIGPRASVALATKDAEKGASPSPTGAEAIAATLANPLGQRLLALLGDERQAAIARVFYDRIEKSAAVQRVTVAHTLVDHGYARMRYDYMSGYIYMFVLGLIGLWITFMFASRERRGLISKFGLMEAEEELRAHDEAKAREKAAQAVAEPGAPASAPAAGEEPRFYVPGYTGLKLAVALLFSALFAWGCIELAKPLGLLFGGRLARAECVRVVKAKSGDADIVYTDDTQLEKAHETTDRGFVFWNEYRLADQQGRPITDATGKPIEVRCTVGSQLKPLSAIIDADGLPSSHWVRFDAQDPQHLIFTALFSTWFIPGILTLIGAVGAWIGFAMVATSRKPIELPRLHRDTETSMHLKPASGGH